MCEAFETAGNDTMGKQNSMDKTAAQQDIAGRDRYFQRRESGHVKPWPLRVFSASKGTRQLLAGIAGPRKIPTGLASMWPALRVFKVARCRASILHHKICVPRSAWCVHWT